MQLLLLLLTLLSHLLLPTTTSASPTPTNPRLQHQATSLSPPPPGPTSTPRCEAKVFNLPWVLSDLTIFTPSDQTTSQDNSTHGTISFHFSDPNSQLQLGTDCSGTVIDGSCGALDGGYVLCANSNVAFRLEEGVVMLERGYVDDCLGPWPYNSGLAFGQNQTRLVLEEEEAGVMGEQERLLVEITALA